MKKFILAIKCSDDMTLAEALYYTEMYGFRYDVSDHSIIIGEIELK